MTPALVGTAAIRAALDHGVPLLVLNPQRGWIPGGDGALRIARRALEHGWATWIYGADLPDRRAPRMS